MIRKIDGVLLSSPNAKRLAAFYRDTVGVKFQSEWEMGEHESVFVANWKGSSDFVVMDHSKVKGKSKGPERYMLNFEVDDIEKEVKRLKKSKVKIVADIYHIENYGHVATFEDPDGNFFQLVQVREK
jgi:predicted enzyme related to lactoylglutathione lyase